MAEELSIVRKPALVPAPTLRDIAAVLFRQRRLWMISFGMVLLAVFLYGIFAPSYQAEMKMMIRRGRLDPVMAPTPTQTPQFPDQQISDAELNSQVELLRDDKFCEPWSRVPVWRKVNHGLKNFVEMIQIQGWTAPC